MYDLKPTGRKQGEKKLLGIVLDCNYLDRTPHVQATEAKVTSVTIFKLKIFCTKIGTLSKMKRQAMK